MYRFHQSADRQKAPVLPGKQGIFTLSLGGFVSFLATEHVVCRSVWTVSDFRRDETCIPSDRLYHVDTPERIRRNNCILNPLSFPKKLASAFLLAVMNMSLESLTRNPSSSSTTSLLAERPFWNAGGLLYCSTIRRNCDSWWYWRIAQDFADFCEHATRNGPRWKPKRRMALACGKTRTPCCRNMSSQWLCNAVPHTKSEKQAGRILTRAGPELRTQPCTSISDLDTEATTARRESNLRGMRYE